MPLLVLGEIAALLQQRHRPEFGVLADALPILVWR
jgi:hypothetical protein